MDNNVVAEEVQNTVVNTAKKIDPKGAAVIATVAVTLIGVILLGAKKYKDHQAAKTVETKEVNPEDMVSDAQA